jgi:hypothetical protein
MKTYSTEYNLMTKDRGVIKMSGDRVEAITWEHAEIILKKTGRSHMRVIGQLISEIPCDENLKPDWSKRIDYDYDLN